MSSTGYNHLIIFVCLIGLVLGGMALHKTLFPCEQSPPKEQPEYDKTKASSLYWDCNSKTCEGKVLYYRSDFYQQEDPNKAKAEKLIKDFCRSKYEITHDSGYGEFVILSFSCLD